MELALSLGDTPKPFSLLDHHTSISQSQQQQKMKDLGFCMGLGKKTNIQDLHFNMSSSKDKTNDIDADTCKKLDESKSSSSSSDPSPPPLQLDLLPFTPVLRSPPQSSGLSFPWLSKNVEPGSQAKPIKVLDGKSLTILSDQEAGEDSSPNNSNSQTSSFQMDFASILKNGRKRDMELAKTSLELVEISNCSRGMSDEDENGLTRKKLRLTKEQSAFLEDSFKEHSTLNPKQKQALAKQLNLRPRQVEVWFQNRRARTKLKQTEVDCEYLKRCCETLTEENRRLQKELQELRALKTTQPFYMQMPATTLTMCPSCERVATTTTTHTATASPRTQQPVNNSHRH
nr:homeobox-leucine zipper protein HAT14-like [Tanacetum cinerariifolium]